MSARKKWLIAALVLILIGAAVCVGVWLIDGFEFTKLNTTNYDLITYDVRDEFRSISIDAMSEDVRLHPSEDGQCSVVCHETKDLTHTVSVEDGVLTVRTVDQMKWYDRAGIHPGVPSIELYLTQAAYESLTVNNDTGDVNVPADFSFDSFSIHASTGDVHSNASVKNALDVSLSTGDIEMSGLSAGSVRLTVTTGDIRVESVDCAGEFYTRVSTGKVTLTDVDCGALVSEGTTGSVTLRCTVAESSIRIERSTGDVRLEDSDAETVTIKTTTGDVSGSLRSEKQFRAKTGSGSIRVPDTNAGGLCEITTSTGDIRIEIK